MKALGSESESSGSDGKSATVVISRQQETMWMLELPNGWSEIENTRERIIAKTDDGHEQATISMMAVRQNLPIVSFEEICRYRLELERRSVGTEVRVTGPSDEGDRFVVSYTGVDPTNARLFSGFMMLRRSQNAILVVYVEGVGVDGKRHISNFVALVTAARAQYERLHTD